MSDHIKIDWTVADLRARIAALEAQLAERVKVLDWRGEEGGPGCDCFSEPTPYLTYHVRHLSDGRFDVILNTDTGSLWFSERGEYHTTYAEAKAAAQADFERRILSALEATPPAPKVTATTDHDPKLGTTLHLMKQSWESRQPTNSGAPKVTDEMVERACRVHNVGWSLWKEPQKKTAREVMRAALTAAQEAGKP